jgi:hypothetical protein
MVRLPHAGHVPQVGECVHVPSLEVVVNGPYDSRGLDNVEREAIRLLARGVDVRKVLSHLNRSEAWLRGVCARPEFLEEYNRVQDARTDRVIEQMDLGKSLADKAMAKLREWLEDPLFVESASPTREQIHLIDTVLDRFGAPRNQKIEAKAEKSYADRVLPQLEEIAAGRRDKLDVEGGRPYLPGPVVEIEVVSGDQPVASAEGVDW